MAESITDVLGGFGPGTTIKACGKEWSFVFDVPAMIANVEELCRQWHREQFDKELKSLPGRDVVGSFDSRMAEKMWEEFRAECKNGACDLPRPQANGMPGPAGAVYEKWSKTSEGVLGMLLAALRVKHPDATLMTLDAIAVEKPEELRLVGEDLKNVARTLPRRMAASLKSTNPAVAEMLMAKVDEMEARLSGSPA